MQVSWWNCRGFFFLFLLRWENLSSSLKKSHVFVRFSWEVSGVCMLGLCAIPNAYARVVCNCERLTKKRTGKRKKGENDILVEWLSILSTWISLPPPTFSSPPTHTQTLPIFLWAVCFSFYFISFLLWKWWSLGDNEKSHLLFGFVVVECNSLIVSCTSLIGISTSNFEFDYLNLAASNDERGKNRQKQKKKQRRILLIQKWRKKNI